MTGYLVNFAVYTMAMIGAILLCFVIYKKTVIDSKFSKNVENNLEVENALNLSQRKTLYVIKAGDEKFLIAADAERTSFLAKLNAKDSDIDVTEPLNCTIDVEPVNLNPKQKRKNKAPIDYSEVMKSVGQNKKPMMREIIRKLNIPE